MRCVWGVDQQGDGRLELFARQEGQRQLSIRGALHQHDIRGQPLQRRAQAARAAGTVVAYPEDVDGHR